VTEVGGFFRSLQLAERVTYDSFGSPRITGPGPDGLMDTADDVVLPQSAFGNLYFFTGREWDPETGLIYMRARYYDPYTGTFLQEDSIRGFLRNPSTQHHFAYARNNPLRYIDPSGNQTVAGLIAGLLVGAAVAAVTIILILEGTRVEREAQSEIRKRQGPNQSGELCPLEDFIALQERFEENRAEIIESGELEVVTTAAGVAGAATPEGQAVTLGTEIGVAVGEATQKPQPNR